MDFSDLSFSPPLTPKHHPKPAAGDPFPPEEEEVAPGERFGVILKRNRSSASQRFRPREKTHGGPAALHAAMSRAFSMRKPSSSATDAYRRIHEAASDDAGADDEVDMNSTRKATKPRKKKGTILGACKRLFGF
ncbi:unnamed protein product [Spirodela intermedia]|uniref:Uncharacterized protein n=1 Tax=Spirodela intermedia TaxID=51605 RepID=A0A7I8KFN1_SPIIN|nr:unnamed protein product [Spirodela intermedia]